MGDNTTKPVTLGERQNPFASIALTFVPHDVPHRSWFALWDRSCVDPGLFQPPSVLVDHEAIAAEARHGSFATNAADLMAATEPGTCEVDLVLPAPSHSVITRRGTPRRSLTRTHHVVVTARRLELPAAIRTLALLGHHENTSLSAQRWAVVARWGLQLVAAGHIRPAISPDGFDMWRVATDRSDIARLVDELARCLPPEALCHAVSPTMVRDPADSVRASWNALADTLARSSAAERVSASHLFLSDQPTKAPHLRPWVGRIQHADQAAHPFQLSVTEVGGSSPDSVTDPERPAVWRVEISPLDGAEGFNKLRMLQSIKRAASLWSPLHRYPELSGEPGTSFEINSDDMISLMAFAEGLHASDVSIIWPQNVSSDALELEIGPPRPAPTKRQRKSSSSGSPWSTERIHADSQLSTAWQVSLRGTPLTGAELDDVLRSNQRVVRLRGEWVQIPERVRSLLRQQAPTMRIGTLAGGLLDGSIDHPLTAEPLPIRAVGQWADMLDGLRSLAEPTEIETPDGLDAELRPYQRRGAKWLSTLIELGVGGCLADDMGLGKTIQVIATHRAAQLRRLIDSADYRSGEASPIGPTLVVCPTSVIGNWEREIHRFSPATRVVSFHGLQRSLDATENNSGSTALDPDTIVLTTYGVIRRSSTELATYVWDLVVADEAQHIKNHRSATAIAMRSIPARSRIALTGTPIENRLADLWSILDWALPGLLGNHESFKRRYALPVERDNSARAMARLNRRVAPFLLRRVKTDAEIAPDLPPKIERDVTVDLTDEQADLYRTVSQEHLAKIKMVDGFERRGHVLAMLTALKQVTNHPAHYLGQADPLADRSGKLTACETIVQHAVAQKERVLVFSQYVKMGRLLVHRFAELGYEVALLDGSLNPQARQALVDRFQAGEIDVLVLSLRAAGAGINLTAATQVIHYDRWWNPAVEDQASDRAHRIGQTTTVVVHRLIANGTLERRIADVLEGKRKLAKALTAGGEGWICDLTDDELADLVLLSPLARQDAAA